MIKIISNIEHPSNQMLSMFNLCKLFNDNKYPCEIYFPTGNFYDSPQAKPLSDFKAENSDTIILNDISITNINDLHRTNKLISDHTNLKFKIKNHLQYLISSKHHPFKKLILIVSDPKFPIGQRRKLNRSLFDSIITNTNRTTPTATLDKTRNKVNKIAGIIDDIEKNNKIEDLITQALQDNMKKIILFSYLKDPTYYYQSIEPMMRDYPNKIFFAGFQDNRQELYNQLSDLYSYRNVLAQKECLQADIHFHSLEITKEKLLTNTDILTFWQQLLS